MVYGISYDALGADVGLLQFRRDLLAGAARQLDRSRMLRFDIATGYLNTTDLGRVASHFYIKHASVEVFNEFFEKKSVMTEADMFAMVSHATEFEQIKVRDDEMDELDFLQERACKLLPDAGPDDAHGKVNILLQAFISGAELNSFSLISDAAYVAQNAGRIARALFEVSVRNGWPLRAARLLKMCCMLDRRLWSTASPLRQLVLLPPEIVMKIEDLKLSLYKLRELSASDIGHMLRHPKMGERVKEAVNTLPNVEITASIQPITRTVLRVTLAIEPCFTWNSKVHGSSESFWIWVEDANNEHLYHSELFVLQAEKCRARNRDDRIHSVTFTIPIFEPLPLSTTFARLVIAGLDVRALFPCPSNI